MSTFTSCCALTCGHDWWTRWMWSIPVLQGALDVSLDTLQSSLAWMSFHDLWRRKVLGQDVGRQATCYGSALQGPPWHAWHTVWLDGIRKLLPIEEIGWLQIRPTSLISDILIWTTLSTLSLAWAVLVFIFSVHFLLSNAVWDCSGCGRHADQKFWEIVSLASHRTERSYKAVGTLDDLPYGMNHLLI